MTKIKAVIMAIKDMTKDDIDNFKDWVWKMRHINLFEPKVVSYPRTVMCKAYTDDEALLYMPLQACLMYDSLAPKPDLSPRKEAFCLYKIVEQVDNIARDTGFGETYFICRDSRVSDIAAAHGFTEIKDVRILKRVVDLRPAVQEAKEVTCNS